MISLEKIKNFYSPLICENPAFRKYMIKEYVLLSILDHLSGTAFIRKLSFIGGTNLRLTKGIDRFSEDLDFDCKNFSVSEFDEMTGSVLLFLQRSGLKTEVRDKTGDNLKAFQRNIFFPQLLFDMNLTAHKEERFLIKIECQDQQIKYTPRLVNIKGCGFFFPFPVPPDPVLCSMKLAALLNRSKGRDFYDTMFLLEQIRPDWDFLSARCGIQDAASLKDALTDLADRTNLANKVKDFEHLIFEKRHGNRILEFGNYIRTIL